MSYILDSLLCSINQRADPRFSQYKLTKQRIMISINIFSVGRDQANKSHLLAFDFIFVFFDMTILLFHRNLHSCG